MLTLTRLLVIQENDTETATEYASLRSGLEIQCFLSGVPGVFQATRRVSSPLEQAFYVQSHHQNPGKVFDSLHWPVLNQNAL